MRVYLAARYSRRHELIGYALWLEARGHEVTSRWLNYHDDPRNEHVLRGDETPDEALRKRGEWAQIDVADIDAADVLITFTERTADGRVLTHGGQFVEFGYALGQHKRLICVGPPQSVFHCLPSVEHFDTWEGVLDALAAVTA